MGIRLANEEITLTLSPERALLTLAALHVFGWLAKGEDDDPDTALTAEAFDTFLSCMRQAFGGDNLNQSVAHSDEIKDLAEQLERDMLAIVHRNYRRTTEGFVKK